MEVFAVHPKIPAIYQRFHQRCDLIIKYHLADETFVILRHDNTKFMALLEDRTSSLTEILMLDEAGSTGAMYTKE
jgi:hypothetical protein